MEWASLEISEIFKKGFKGFKLILFIFKNSYPLIAGKELFKFFCKKFPEFKNCLFSENISESDAGSIFIGNSPSDSILINNSTFYNLCFIINC